MVGVPTVGNPSGCRADGQVLGKKQWVWGKDGRGGGVQGRLGGEGLTWGWAWGQRLVQCLKGCHKGIYVHPASNESLLHRCHPLASETPCTLTQMLQLVPQQDRVCHPLASEMPYTLTQMPELIPHQTWVPGQDSCQSRADCIPWGVWLRTCY